MRYSVGHIFIVLIIVLVAYFAERTPTGSKTNTQTQYNTKVFFTPGTDCEENIIAEINKASTVDVAVYSISNQDIVNSMIAAHKRGAKIRVITDRTQAKVKGSLVDTIRSTGIPVVTNKKHKIEHNKFAIFDNKYIVTGSYNWTTNATQYNSENCNFFEYSGKEYNERFEYLWNLYNSE